MDEQFLQGPFGKTAASEGKPDLVVDQDRQCKITLYIEGKADRTAKGSKKRKRYVR